ncbi:AfsR/SARP family transcriptional regulator [Micromonospora arborensis]|uniref:AfsR/SARP family transcriptional regulator n=1 Tax=Micromonospora arborensis TaxID=2116518 RepID=UPI0033CFD73C
MLGPLELCVNGRNIAPTAAKPRQVISLLLMRRNSLVLPEEFIEELWDTKPPKSAATTLQTYIYHLRKILVKNGAERLLTTHPGGYRLTVEEEWVDLWEFERSFRTGRAALDEGRPAEASRILQSAVNLWRGPSLADVEQGKLLYSYTTWLHELRLRALELRIEADLQIGRHREVASELKSLVLRNPMDEHMHGLLMIALYGAGRRHEALEQYRELRVSMIEELGIEPGHDLKKIHQEMLSDICPVPSMVPAARAQPRLA